MNTGAMVARKQNRYMRRFREAGATDPASAKTLEELGCRGSFIFTLLVRRGVFVEASTGRYYLDLEATETFLTRRRTVAIVAVVLFLVTIVVLLWVG